MRPLQSGDICLVIDSIDRISVGRTVKVISLQGQHSKWGNIWRCRGLNGALISEYGAVGDVAEFAQSWLQRIDPIKTPDNVKIEELEE